VFQPQHTTYHHHQLLYSVTTTLCRQQQGLCVCTRTKAGHPSPQQIPSNLSAASLFACCQQITFPHTFKVKFICTAWWGVCVSWCLGGIRSSCLGLCGSPRADTGYIRGGDMGGPHEGPRPEGYGPAFKSSCRPCRHRVLLLQPVTAPKLLPVCATHHERCCWGRHPAVCDVQVAAVRAAVWTNVK
jgi:hypothetical protein